MLVQTLIDLADAAIIILPVLLGLAMLSIFARGFVAAH